LSLLALTGCRTGRDCLRLGCDANQPEAPKLFPDCKHGRLPPQHAAGPRRQKEQDTTRGPTQALEPTPPALCTFNAGFPRTARTAQKDLPKGIYGSYSAIRDSIPFSMSSRKRRGRNGSPPASPTLGEAGSLPCTAASLSPAGPAHPCCPTLLPLPVRSRGTPLPSRSPYSTSLRSLQRSARLPSPAQTQPRERLLSRAWWTQQGRGSPPPLAFGLGLRVSTARWVLPSWMSTHTGAKQVSTLPPVHCGRKEGRRQHEAGKARMTSLSPHSLRQPRRVRIRMLTGSAPQSGQWGDNQQRPKGLLQGRGPGGTR